jgi:hypothetical protein
MKLAHHKGERLLATDPQSPKRPTQETSGRALLCTNFSGNPAARLDTRQGGVPGLMTVRPTITEAWLDAVDALLAPGVKALGPLVVTVEGFDVDGDLTAAPAAVSQIDQFLRSSYRRRVANKPRSAALGPPSVESVASTIFPQSLWNPQRDRHELYSRYLGVLPRLKLDVRNKRGLYFERLVNYGRGPRAGNQLEHMFSAFHRGIRRKSAFQAVIVDPALDHKETPLLGFPCLQQIAVHPNVSQGTLAITGFYGTQYVFERGFGNYLGLCRLGRFIAHEMRLRLSRMTCIASYVPIEASGKTRGRALVRAVRRSLDRGVPPDGTAETR